MSWSISIPTTRRWRVPAASISARKIDIIDTTLFTRFADRLVDAVMLVESDGRVLAANARACRELSGAPGGLVGRLLSELVAQDPARTGECLRRWAGTSAPLPASLSFRTTGGEIVPCRCYGALLQPSGPHGRARIVLQCLRRAEAVSLFTDLNRRLAETGRRLHTQRRERQSLERTLAELEVTNQSMVRLLAELGHEIRQPLTALLGYSELLVQELYRPIASERSRAYAQRLHEGGFQLLQLVTNLLESMRGESSEPELQEDETDLGALLMACHDLMQGQAPHYGVRLETVAAAGPRVRADEVKLKQIVLNLLSNALKFTEPGGLVRVEVALPAGGDIVLRVVDDGIGMSEAEQQLALTPFGQVGRCPHGRQLGVGLGLPLARRFAELHGGTLKLASAPGRGTTVSVTLPRSRLLGEPACHAEAEPG